MPLLKIGSTGPDVSKLQMTLGIAVDGSFGTATETAVKAFQAQHNLVADGIVGDNTWAILFPSAPAEDLGSLKISKLTGVLTANVLSQIPSTAIKFNITTNLRLAHFLSQCAHESGNFQWVTEFATGSEYEGRLDLGNTQPGDGVRFKGRGYIQLTGRANYTAFSKFCGEDCVTNPELVAVKYPMMSAAYFFNSNGLWATCDLGDTTDCVKAVTKRVNGGYNGLEERQSYFTKFWTLLK